MTLANVKVNNAPDAGTSGIYAVIMAGGAGTRLWPESRQARPKPFLPLAPDGRSLIAATSERLDGLVPEENRFVVAGRRFADLVAQTLPNLRADRILLEPLGRNTAPCVAWAALEIARLDPDATIVVLPSDHWIAPDDAFRRALADAVRLVEEDPDRLATLGVAPTAPSSAYGYIERDAEIPGRPGAFNVARFCEKPDPERARSYLATQRFFWNAGIFVWKARRILELIERFEPELAATLAVLRKRVDACGAAGTNTSDDPEFADAFRAAKSVSIDYAVLERASNVVVLAADAFRWDDVGSYAALERLGAPSAAEITVVDGSNGGSNGGANYVRIADAHGKAPAKKLVAFGRVDNLLVVDTPDALMIARKDDDDAIKEIVETLRARGLDEYL